MIFWHVKFFRHINNIIVLMLFSMNIVKDSSVIFFFHLHFFYMDIAPFCSIFSNLRLILNQY